MTVTIRKSLFFLVVVLWHLSCSNQQQNNRQSLSVFAPASLQEVVTEVIDSFESIANIDVAVNFASSGTLARQIEQGAKPDVFISANRDWIMYLDSLGLIVENAIFRICSNSLVIIAPISNHDYSSLFNQPVDNTESFKNFKLAMGNPKHVPAGMYAKEVLEKYGIYKLLEKRIIPTKDVRTSLMLVEMNEADLGIVYATDAAKSKKVKVVEHINSSDHGAIEYLAGLFTDTAQGLNFLNFIRSNKTREIFIKHGFKY